MTEKRVWGGMGGTLEASPRCACISLATSQLHDIYLQEISYLVKLESLTKLFVEEEKKMILGYHTASSPPA